MATSTPPGSALWQPQAHMPTVSEDRLTIVRGEGARIQTDEGRWLLDATAGLWHANIGHGRARLADAAAEQMRRLETYHTFGRITNDRALALADRVAAVFAEPVIGTGGVIPPAEGYLPRIEAVCREHDVLLVLDEVITGFGRTGEMFATQLFDLRPDMITMAKGITSGYAPLGGVLVAPRVWRPFFEGDDAPIFRHGVTYSGHATACAVAQANLDVIEEEDLVARVARLTPELANAVAPLADHPLVAEVRAGVGLLAGVQLQPDVSGDAVTRHCLEDGILLRVITNNTLQISPPFVVDADDLRRIAAAIARALDTLAR